LISVADPECFIPDPDLTIFSSRIQYEKWNANLLFLASYAFRSKALVLVIVKKIRDPGGNKAPDPGSGSAILHWGCGGSVDIALTSKSRLPTQQSRDRIRQLPQSPERGQDIRLCIKNKPRIGRRPYWSKKTNRTKQIPVRTILHTKRYAFLYFTSDAPDSYYQMGGPMPDFKVRYRYR
jgi:hypothetical protein